MKLIYILCLILITENSFGQFVGTPYIFNSISDLPQVTTHPVTNIFSTKATSGGKIVSAGSFPITSKGVVWSTSQNPTILDSKSTVGPGTTYYLGSTTNYLPKFTSNVSGLNSGTTYYVRAYATNSFGTAYGEEVSFTTPLTNPTLSIGDYYEGGYIFYILSPGDTIDKGGAFPEIFYQEGEIHGLIVAGNLNSLPASISNRLKFGESGTLTNETILGYGKKNTENIIALYGTTTYNATSSAAASAYLYTDGIRNDWYLPSKAELEEIQKNSSNYSQYFDTSESNHYWSSSDNNNINQAHFYFKFWGTKKWLTDERSRTFNYFIIRSF